MQGKGIPERKVYLSYLKYHVEQQGSGADSLILQQQQVASAIDSVNVHQAGAQNFENSVTRPPSSPASSSKRRSPACRKNHLGVRDFKILARLNSCLSKEEQDLIMRLVECAREAARQSSTKSTELVEVIPDKNSKAAPMIETTNKNVVSIEDSDDESNNISI